MRAATAHDRDGSVIAGAGRSCRTISASTCCSACRPSLLGIAISLPLAIVAARARVAARAGAAAVASIVQTIPGLALLALFYPLLLALSAFTQRNVRLSASARWDFCPRCWR